MSSGENVDLALWLVGTVAATRVELSLANLSPTTKDFFHSRTLNSHTESI